MLTGLLVIVYISFISLGLPSSLMGAAWPSMYYDFSVPSSYMGIVSLITMTCTVISTMTAGKVIKIMQEGKIVACGIIMIISALIVICLSNNFIFLCLAVIPLGLGMGYMDAVLNNVAATHFKLCHNNWMHCTWGLGATIGPMFVSASLTLTNSWRPGFIAIFIILSAVLILIFLTLNVWKNARKESCINTIKSVSTCAAHSSTFTSMFKLKGMKYTLLVFFSYCAVEMTVGMWGSSYFVIEKGVHEAGAAMWLSLYYLGITSGRFLSGFLTIKISNSQMIRIGCATFIMGIALIILNLGNFFYMLSFFVMGLGLAPIFPCVMHLTPTRFGTEHSQQVVGMQIAASAIGAATVPPLFGVIASKIGYSHFSLFLLVFVVIMVSSNELTQKLFKEQ